MSLNSEQKNSVRGEQDSDELGFFVSCLPLVLLSSWPFVGFLATNKLEAIYAPRILLIWLAFMVLCFTGLGILKLIFRGQPVARLSTFLGALSAWFFSYSPISRVLAGWGIVLGIPRLLIWLVIAIFISFVVLRMRKIRELPMVAITVAVAMMAVPVVQLAAYYAQPITEIAKKQVDQPIAIQGVKLRPNVYWLMLDSYTRDDVLKMRAGYDNTPFLKALEKRGFRIGWQSLSNLTTTMRSLSTTVTMDYYLPVGEKLRPKMWSAKLQGFSPVVERFKSHGYRYIHAESGSVVLNTRCGGNEDRCIKGPVRGGLVLSEAEVGLLELTPLFPVIRIVYPSLLNIDRADVKDVIKALGNQSEEPFFVFAHVLSPHTPNRYKKNCTRRDHIEWNSGLKQLNNPMIMEGYITDIKCIIIKSC